MQRMLRLFLVFLFFVFSNLPVFAEPVDINQADAATLSSNLKGVGVKKARAIVEYRAKHGRFKTADDLVKVKGIGVKIVETNRKDIIIGSSAKLKP